MSRYAILDKDGNLLAVVDAESAEQAIGIAIENHPTAVSAEEKYDPTPRGAI